MKITAVAFIVAPVTGSLLYKWLSAIEYLNRTSVMRTGGLGFLGLTIAFAYIGTLLLALPAYLLLKRLRLNSDNLILIAGTLIGWLFISFMDDGKAWLHPDAFAVGMVTTFTFFAYTGGVATFSRLWFP